MKDEINNLFEELERNKIPTVYQLAGASLIKGDITNSQMVEILQNKEEEAMKLLIHFNRINHDE